MCLSKSLKYIKKFKPRNVLIHDAARPNFSIKLLKKLVHKLKKNKAVIPYTYSKDSIKYKSQNQLFNLNRNALLRFSLIRGVLQAGTAAFRTAVLNLARPPCYFVKESAG